MDSAPLTVLFFGFLLGLKHATDADHVVAVSTLVEKHRNVWRGLWVGVSWGLGHTTPLLILGVMILIFKATFLDRYAGITWILETGVGMMLVALGLQVFGGFRKGRLHVHQHDHGDKPHLHVHGTHVLGIEQHTTGPFSSDRAPIFRAKSFFIGMVHGVAGTAAVMLLLLPEIEGLWVGLGYLLIFGVGTMISMAAITVLIGIPFAISRKMSFWGRGITGLAGASSLVLGFAIILDSAFGRSITLF